MVYRIILCALCLLSELCGIALCEQCLDLFVNILSGVAEFLVEHLVGSREAEALETPDATVGTYETLEGDGQTGGHAELLLATWQHALLILLRLAAEESL